MSANARILCPTLKQRLMTAEKAAELIPAGANVGMSGFTGAGYPKVVPGALAERIRKLNACEGSEPFRINVWTGASTAPELDGVLAEVDGISGFLGKMDIALIEVAGIREDGSLIPSSSIGNNKTWIEQADKIILEVNSKQNIKLEGMHDVYYGTALPPHRKPIMLTNPSDRIGEFYFECPPEKVIAVVESDAADRNSPFKASDETSQKIAQHILDFFEREIELGRLPKELLPIQSGVGNIPNAVLEGLDAGPFKNLTAFTEVIQDGMLKMLKSGTLSVASATAFSLSPEGIKEFDENIDLYRDKIILRQQDISNHLELARRLGIIAMHGMIECPPILWVPV